MKKVLLSLLAGLALTATSCSSVADSPKSYEDSLLAATLTSCLSVADSPKSYEDSLAYVLGVDIAGTLKVNVDSTLNYKQLAQGIIDAFENKTTLTEKDTKDFMRNYYQVVKPKKDAEAKEKLAVENEKKSAEFLAKMAKEAGVVASETGLLYNVETEGEGRKIQLNDTVSLHYVLKNMQGEVIQASKDSGRPFRFANVEGPRGMIKGFSEGISHLATGGKATLYIPYDLGYGEQGSAIIGPKEALVFEVEVLEVVEPTAKKK